MLLTPVSIEVEQQNVVLLEGEEAEVSGTGNSAGLSLQVGDFPLLAVISDGCTSTIYDTTCQSIDKPLAVKVFNTPLTRQGALTFNQVAEQAKAVDHPHVAAIYDFGFCDGEIPYVVTEKAVGDNLQQILRERRKLDANATVGVFSQLCDALEYCHRHGIAVGDLTPASIFVTDLDSTPYVKLTGAGIARNCFEKDISARSLIAADDAAKYASPERCLGNAIDERSLVYTVGCMLYEATYGQLAFNAADPIKLLFEHVNLAEVSFPKSNARFETLIRKCLVKKAEDRIKDLRSLRIQLEQLSLPEQKIALLADNTGKNCFSEKHKYVASIVAIAILLTVHHVKEYCWKITSLQRQVEVAIMSESARSPDDAIALWKVVQKSGIHLSQPASFMGDVEMKIAHLCENASQLDKANDHFLKAAALYRSQRLPFSESEALRGYTSHFFSWGPDELGSGTFSPPIYGACMRQLHLLERHAPGNTAEIKRYLSLLTGVCASDNRWLEAGQFANRSVVTYGLEQDAWNQWAAAVCAHRQNNLQQAEYWYRRALTGSEGLNSYERYKVRLGLARALREQNKMKEALHVDTVGTTPWPDAFIRPVSAY